MACRSIPTGPALWVLTGLESALGDEISRHDFSTFLDEKPSMAQGGGAGRNITPSGPMG